jgi:hypothetical protein
MKRQFMRDFQDEPFLSCLQLGLLRVYDMNIRLKKKYLGTFIFFLDTPGKPRVQKKQRYLVIYAEGAYHA